MGAFKYIPPREVDARHRAAARPKTSPREQREGEQKNVEAVLSLGSVRYFSYRRLVLAIPPVPFKLGQRVLDVYIRSLADARQVTKTGSEQATKSYYVQMEILSKLLWKHVRPTGFRRRLLKRLGLMRNVLKTASEKELQEITTFFLEGRMMSSVQAMETAEKESTQMFSMNLKSS